MTERLLLFDAPSVWFRAYYGVPDSVVAPDGTPVNAVRGFLDYVSRQLSERRPDRFVAALDLDWRPQWRVDLVPAYKLHRVAADGGDGTPDPLAPQVDVILEVLAAAGLPALGAEDYEADDVIGTLCAQGRGPVDVVTGDRDLFQLVCDEPFPVRIVYTVDRLRVYGPAEIAAKYGIPGTAYADYALLRGDASDGLPGVAGIGDKGAAALVSRFGGIAGIRAALAAGEGAAGGHSGFPAGARLKLERAADYLAAAEPVVRVATDVGLPDVDDRVPPAPRDPARLVELADRWGLDGPLERLLAALEVVASR